MDPEFCLTVCPCPDKDLAYYNCIFVNEGHFCLQKRLPEANWVQVNGKIIYRAEGHPDIKVGCVGLSAPQRATLKCVEGRDITVEESKTDIIPEISHLIVYVVRHPEIIKLCRESVMKLIRCTIHGQVINIGQTLISDRAMSIVFTVNSLQGMDGSDLSVGVFNATKTQTSVILSD